MEVIIFEHGISKTKKLEIDLEVLVPQDKLIKNSAIISTKEVMEFAMRTFKFDFEELEYEINTDKQNNGRYSYFLKAKIIHRNNQEVSLVDIGEFLELYNIDIEDGEIKIVNEY